MIKMRKPERVPTIAMLVVVVTCLWLSVWQLQRLAQKNELLASIETAQALPPKDLHAFSEAELLNSEWRNVVATGVFLHEHELHATPRYLRNTLGYAILTPLAITNGHETQYVLVNRGWVPREKREASERSEGNITGAVIVEGNIRLQMKQKMFTPDNQPDINLWFWYDLPAMAKKTGLKLLPIIIDAAAVRSADGSEIKNAPEPFPVEIKIRNDHAGYAVTWFLLALSALGVWVAYHIEKKST